MSLAHHALNRPRREVHQDPAVGDQVAAWRRQRMSWAAIARALGRPEAATRAAFDPDWKGRR
jgi:hypothetical protein